MLIIFLNPAEENLCMQVNFYYDAAKLARFVLNNNSRGRTIDINTSLENERSFFMLKAFFMKDREQFFSEFHLAASFQINSDTTIATAAAAVAAAAAAAAAATPYKSFTCIRLISEAFMDYVKRICTSLI